MRRRSAVAPYVSPPDGSAHFPASGEAPDGLRARRKPPTYERDDGTSVRRSTERQYAAPLPQLPPRSTRSQPPLLISGSVVAREAYSPYRSWVGSNRLPCRSIGERKRDRSEIGKIGNDQYQTGPAFQSLVLLGQFAHRLVLPGGFQGELRLERRRVPPADSSHASPSIRPSSRRAYRVVRNLGSTIRMRLVLPPDDRYCPGFGI